MESKSWAENYLFFLVKWQDLRGRDMHFCREIIHTVLTTTERILSNPNVVWHDHAEVRANEAKEIATALASKPPDVIMLDGCDSYAKIRVEDDGAWMLFFNFLICTASRLVMSASNCCCPGGFSDS